MELAGVRRALSLTRGRTGVLAAMALAAMLATLAGFAIGTGSSANAASLRHGPGKTRIDRHPRRFVRIPRRIPHAHGTYIDKRLLPNLRWIADHFRIYVTEGYAGRLHGRRIGCPKCHVSHSDHKIGLAVDIVPHSFSTTCDRSWRPITRLAHWAEPTQNQPVPPFRWVGYDGDAGHGCGNHLHLSWIHAAKYERGTPSRWVEVFRVRHSQSKSGPSSAVPLAKSADPLPDY